MATHTGPLDEDGWHTLAAIADRIYPPADGAPGAVDLGAVEYLREMLSSPWGAGANLYAAGPVRLPEHPGHGEQHALTPIEIYRAGLRALHDASVARHGAPFRELSPQAQDALLRECEQDRLSIASALRSSQFFDLVLQTVTEGLFGDPRHGGNRDREGWRWIGYDARGALA